MNTRPTALNGQRGFVAMAAALLLGIAVAAVLLGNLSARQHEIHTQARTPEALVEAKRAVLGYITLDSPDSNKLSESPNLKPGSLPCPDTDGNNVSDLPDYAGTSCRSGALAFRFPNKNFLTADLRDSANERLWYAISPEYSTNTSSALNSDTVATLRINGAGEYVAVVAAPQSALAGQTRGNSGDRTAYLEDLNSSAGPNFVTHSTGPFNDKLIGISSAEWEAAASRRVANEIIRRLTDFKITNGFFPWAAPWVANPSRSLAAQTGVRKGMLPVADLWPQPPSPISNQDQKKDWFAENEWYRFVYYAVAPAFRYGASGDCANEGCLSITMDGTTYNDVKAVFILAGRKLTHQTRPSAELENFFESAANRDGNDAFEYNGINAMTNDRIYFIR